MTWLRQIPPRQLRLFLASAIGLSAIALVSVGYRAIGEWQEAAGLVASRRASSAVELLVSALSRDMRGAHTSVLAAAERDRLADGSTADLLHPITGAFTRYPYVEAFFSWRTAPDEEVVFYSRVDRRPAWLSGTASTAPYPVNTGSDRRVGRQLLDRLAADTQQGRRFSAFTTRIGGTDYQVVTVISYADAAHAHPTALIGYMVNLDWARRHYFGELASQVDAMLGRDEGVRFAILDDAGGAVVGSVPAADGAPSDRRSFPVAFFDPAAVAVDPPPDLGLTWWSAIAETGDDPTLAAAERGARRTLTIAAVMTLTLAIGVLVSLRAARASADLAAMRVDFVSAVTHELKTPLANLRAINETLASGRATPEMIQEYARMGIGEATRLTRLVDNLLAFSRVTDVADVYSFEPTDVGWVVQRSLQAFTPTLERDRFAVTVEVPDDLPRAQADPNALGLLLNNLIDNAIRYSRQTRALGVRAFHSAAGITIEVSDRGIGIPADELSRVTRKFFRGRTSVAGGSGLGLAIVDRVVADHGGTMGIRSVEGQGTTVSVTIPAAGHEEKSAGR